MKCIKMKRIIPDTSAVIIGAISEIVKKEDLDYPEIKTAYEKAKVKKVVETADFTVKEAEDTAPKFSINKKPSGFNSILGGKR